MGKEGNGAKKARQMIIKLDKVNVTQAEVDVAHYILARLAVW